MRTAASSLAWGGTLSPAALAGRPCSQPPLLFLPHQRETKGEEGSRCVSFRPGNSGAAVGQSCWPGAPLCLPAQCSSCPGPCVPLHASGNRHRPLSPQTSCPTPPPHAAGAKGRLAHCGMQPILVLLGWAQHCGSGRLGFVEVCLTPALNLYHLVLLASQSGWKMWSECRGTLGALGGMLRVHGHLWGPDGAGSCKANMVTQSVEDPWAVCTPC